jgi:hypothetical protein
LPKLGRDFKPPVALSVLSDFRTFLNSSNSKVHQDQVESVFSWLGQKLLDPYH